MQNKKEAKDDKIEDTPDRSRIILYKNYTSRRVKNGISSERQYR